MPSRRGSTIPGYLRDPYGAKPSRVVLTVLVPSTTQWSQITLTQRGRPAPGRRSRDSGADARNREGSEERLGRRWRFRRRLGLTLAVL